MKKNIDLSNLSPEEMAKVIQVLNLQNNELQSRNNKLENKTNKLQSRTDELVKKNIKLTRKNDRLEAEIKRINLKNEELLKALLISNEKFNIQRSQRFGAKTEQNSKNEFNEAEKHSSKSKGRGRTYGSKNFDVSYLESHVTETVYESPQESVCPECGEQLITIGSDTSYKVTVDLSSIDLKVIKYVSEKRVCPSCKKIYQKLKTDNYPNSICTPTLASSIMTNKFLLGVPYYRQSKYMFDQMKVSRQDLCNYQIRSTDLLSPLYKRLKVHLLDSRAKCLCADETTIKVLSEKERSTSYMWVYLSSYYDLPIYYYEYKKDRSRNNPHEFLKGFKGYLLTDAYQGYNDIDNVKNCYCWAHARRKFYDIVKILKPEQLKGSKANRTVELMDVLLSKEKKMRVENYTPSMIKEVRNSKDYLIDLQNVKEYVESISASPESSLGKAVSYLLSRWEGFVMYINDGHIEMTNNISERAIKPYVIARKNFLFNISDIGAESSAVFFSLQQTARANLLNSEKYIAKVLELIKPNMSEEELDELLPWNLKKKYNLRLN